MKKLELDLKKKILLMEIPDNTEAYYKKEITYTISDKQSEFSLLPKGEYKLICKGSELTEEICETLISKKDVAKYQSKMCGLKFKDGFINMVRESGYYWGENPIKKPRVIEYDYFNPLMMELHAKNVKKYKEAESKTFNPEKSLIFEIL